MSAASDDELIDCWTRLTRDPDEGGAFAVLVHTPLVNALSAKHPRTNPDAVVTAVSDALLAFLRKPTAYDPAKSPLFQFLLLVAGRRLMNLYASEARHHRERIPWEAVELGAAARNEEEEAALSFDSPVLQPALSALSDVERQVLGLMRDGERSTAAFAVVLGITGQATDEQAAAVKRVKDRIMARLRRAAGGAS